jgi:hypothetical protein
MTTACRSVPKLKFLCSSEHPILYLQKVVQVMSRNVGTGHRCAARNFREIIDGTDEGSAFLYHIKRLDYEA